jgi:hypothetical protein
LKEGTSDSQKQKALEGAKKTAVAKLLKAEVLME